MILETLNDFAEAAETTKKRKIKTRMKKKK
jgi:hypothetical protein